MLPPDYADRNFWQAGSRHPKGDPAPEALYRSVGETLSGWEMLELGLAELFDVLVESPSEAAARVYGRLGGSAHRLAALKEAAGVFFRRHPETAGESDAFDTLANAFGCAGGRRADIAHGMLMRLGSAEGFTPGEGFIGEKSAGYFRVSPEYQTNKLKDALHPKQPHKDLLMHVMAYAYTSAQVRDYGRRFHAMLMETGRLTVTLRAQLHSSLK